MSTLKTEFFPGLSAEPGMTRCRGWEDGGFELILPYSLVSVEPEQDRYTEFSQLWRDADDQYWMISYRDHAAEWFASCLGEGFENAQAVLASVRAEEIRLSKPTAYRVLEASEGASLEEIWQEVWRESDSIVEKNVRLGTGGNEEIVCEIRFSDYSWLRVLDLDSVRYKGVELIEAFKS